MLIVVLFILLIIVGTSFIF
ncbi:MAG: YjcZ family sporulation protein [Bacillus sp. (in: Bacteria)]|nr:YjcZ family sporulation protein [Bacillus sp. (in: firmicutes)]